MSLTRPIYTKKDARANFRCYVGSQSRSANVPGLPNVDSNDAFVLLFHRFRSANDGKYSTVEAGCQDLIEDPAFKLPM